LRREKATRQAIVSSKNSEYEITNNSSSIVTKSGLDGVTKKGAIKFAQRLFQEASGEIS